MFFCLKERTTYTKTTRSMPGIGQMGTKDPSVAPISPLSWDLPRNPEESDSPRCRKFLIHSYVKQINK